VGQPQRPQDRRLREFIDTHDWITCYFLPAYAPDLNPVEGIWSLLRRGSQVNTAFTTPTTSSALSDTAFARSSPAAAS
jgi:transposase